MVLIVLHNYCQHNGLDQAEPMVRCCICMKWVLSISCCNDSEQDANHAGYTLAHYVEQYPGV